VHRETAVTYGWLTAVRVALDKASRLAGFTAGMQTGWRRLGQRIRTARVRQGMASADQLARAARLSRRTVELLEAGTHPGQPRDATLAKVEHALGWADGAALDIVLGANRPRRSRDPLTDRLLAAWPALTHDMQVTIVTVVETLTRQD